MKTKVRLGGNPFRPTRRVLQRSLLQDSDGDSSWVDQWRKTRLLRRSKPGTHIPRRALANMRASYEALGFTGPLLASDWDPRLGSLATFTDAFPDAMPTGQFATTERRTAWEQSDLVVLPNTFSAHRCTIAIAYANALRLIPYGVVARDDQGAYLLISGSLVKWNPTALLAYLKLALETGRNNPRAQHHLIGIDPAVVAKNPWLVDAVVGGTFPDIGHGIRLARSSVEIRGITLHPTLWCGKLGYDAHRQDKYWFAESDSAEEAAEIAEFNWAVSATRPQWTSGTGYLMLSLLFGEKPFPNWRTILPVVESSKAMAQRDDDRKFRAFFRSSFRSVGDSVTVTMGFCFYEGDAQMAEREPYEEDYKDRAWFSLFVVLGDDLVEVALENETALQLLHSLETADIASLAESAVAEIKMRAKYPGWLRSFITYGGYLGDRLIVGFRRSEPLADPLAGLASREIAGEVVFADTATRHESKPGCFLTWALCSGQNDDARNCLIVERDGVESVFHPPVQYWWLREPSRWLELAAA